MTTMPQPIQYLEDKRFQLGIVDSSLKFVYYLGKLAVLLEVPALEKLLLAKKVREVIWGLATMRDFYKQVQWLGGDRRSKSPTPKLDWMRRFVWIGKKALRVAKCFSSHPRLIQAKAQLGQASMGLTVIKEGWALYKGAIKGKSLPLYKRLDIGDNLCDVIDTLMDLGLIPTHQSAYVALGLTSASCGIAKKSLQLWDPSQR